MLLLPILVAIPCPCPCPCVGIPDVVRPSPIRRFVDTSPSLQQWLCSLYYPLGKRSVVHHVSPCDRFRSSAPRCRLPASKTPKAANHPWPEQLLVSVRCSGQTCPLLAAESLERHLLAFVALANYEVTVIFQKRLLSRSCLVPKKFYVVSITSNIRAHT